MSHPIDHLKKLAKGLLKATQASEADALLRFRNVYADYRNVPDAEVADKVSLGRAQHVVAVEHEFRNWEELARCEPLRVKLAITMARIPSLNDFGIGLYAEDRKKPIEVRQAIMKAERETLVASVERIGHVVDWLQAHVAPIKTLSSWRTSYGNKHIAEGDIGYITNGVFIAAAIIAGYPYRINWGSPNVSFGMSERSLKAIEKDRRDNRRPYAWRMPHYEDSGASAREAARLVKQAAS